jgi:predicted Na+-dependent transporter
MNYIKRYSGIVWMLLGPVAIYYLLQTALSEIARKPLLDTKIQWGVFVIVFIPIAIGMVIFGYFALKGEYDHLPERSEELID